jgi:carboxyl-terminal processing protease
MAANRARASPVRDALRAEVAESHDTLLTVRLQARVDQGGISVAYRTRLNAVIYAAALLLSACGGGGGGSPTVSPPTPPPDPTWTSGVYQSASTFGAYCATPRTGVDPATAKAYPDKLGSVGWENNWIRAWTNAYYLWYAEVIDENPEAYTTPNYFKLMKTMQTTLSGAAKDRFHFTYSTSAWEQLSQSGVSVGYGATWAILAATPPRKVLVAYVDANTAATSAGLVRGASVLTIDNVDLVNANDQTSINTLNAGLSPSTSGESHTFVVQLVPGGAQTTITMVAADITENPVPLVTTVPSNGGVVGYIEFNSHIATAEAGLVSAINQLFAANVNDLVLDIRYNGGGYLDIASELAYMVAGPGPTTNQTFEKETFNDKYPTTNPITGQPLTPTPFWSMTQGFSTTSGQLLPSLNLKRVFVLTSSGTCSASEAIINGLRGVAITVIEVGTTTCGKPYGFYPADNCGTTYFSIQFQGNNNAGFGSYGDGFTPQNATTVAGYAIPGCSVADDFTHQLGDPAEAQFAAALAYRTNGQVGCPTPSGFAPPGVAVAHVMRPEPLMNRILRRPQ